MCTSGTCSYSSMMLTIHHKSLRSVVSPSDVYLRDPSTSDLWDPTAYVSRVPVGPFSISIWPVGPNGLRVTCTCGTIQPVGPNGSHVMCTYGTFLYLHLTYATRRLACHLYLLCHRGLMNSKKPQCLGVKLRTRRKECMVFTIALDTWLY